MAGLTIGGVVQARVRLHLRGIETTGQTGKAMTAFRFIQSLFGTFRAAIHAAAAADMHRTPAARDLDRLGISPAAFRAIHL
ncbi:hypothetical protein GL279_16955 [Paracoccus limosus]|uniref:DUF1127 domain-containing protein n=2 Tax=Paracoccus limosus TaxID=913252 RepID=A0A844HB11_9RHOB|nr:hypothetical protein [Paracoccus limosus]